MLGGRQDGGEALGAGLLTISFLTLCYSQGSQETARVGEVHVKPYPAQMSRKVTIFGISEYLKKYHMEKDFCFKNVTFCPHGTTPYCVLLSNSGQRGQNSDMSPPSKLFSLRPQCECPGLKCPDSATSEAEENQ